MRYKNWKQEIKWTLFLDNVIFYIESPRESAHYRNNKRTGKIVDTKITCKSQ